MHISSHLYYEVYSSCGFQQGENRGITSWTCRHCTLSNSIMCSDSYPIPILCIFFLHHPYILSFLIHACMLACTPDAVTRCSIVMTHQSHQKALSINSHYMSQIRVHLAMTPACVMAIYWWFVVGVYLLGCLRYLEKHEYSLIG